MENYFLTDEEIKIGCQLIEKAGADFVKTSTGYAGGGAKIHDLQIMRSAVSAHVQVKAAGGVRTLDTALAVIAVGGTRMGSTGTAAIIDEAVQREKIGTLCIPTYVADDAI